MRTFAGMVAGVGVAVIAASVWSGGAAVAACPSDGEIDRLVADWRARTPSKAIAADGTIADALCGQDKFVRRLEETLGAPVGYKAGLTSAAAQKRFGVDSPVRGVLLEDMLLEDGATVPAAFGARPLLEADLLVRIGDAAVNGAKTPEEVLAHLSEIIPFIELPDLVVAKGEPINGAVLTAINVGARLGVRGRAIAVAGAPGLADALAAMTVRVTDQDGNELAAARGSMVLGHPLNSVVWLVESGVTLKPGDLVSVGSIGPLLPPQAGRTVTATYEGLPGDPSVSVRFE